MIIHGWTRDGKSSYIGHFSFIGDKTLFNDNWIYMDEEDMAKVYAKGWVVYNLVMSSYGTS